MLILLKKIQLFDIIGEKHKIKRFISVLVLFRVNLLCLWYFIASIVLLLVKCWLNCVDCSDFRSGDVEIVSVKLGIGYWSDSG